MSFDISIKTERIQGARSDRLIELRTMTACGDGGSRLGYTEEVGDREKRSSPRRSVGDESCSFLPRFLWLIHGCDRQSSLIYNPEQSGVECLWLSAQFRGIFDSESPSMENTQRLPVPDAKQKKRDTVLLCPSF